MERVAVIMPYHTGMGEYVVRAIDAIGRQDVHVRLYIVGNNPDRTTQNLVQKVLDRQTNEKFEYKHLFEDEKIGVAFARNRALDYIKLDEDITHVAFCDCDDVWHDDHLTTSLSALSESDMCYSEVNVVDEDGNPLEVYGIPYYKEFERQHLLEQNFIYISTVVLKKEFLVGDFDHDADPMGDWDYWVRVTDNIPDSRVFHILDETVAYLWKTKSGSYYGQEEMSRAGEYVKSKHTVEGWLSSFEGLFLQNMAFGRCLEVGSYKGKSANYIAANPSVDILMCVDTFRCTVDGQTQGEISILGDFERNTRKYVDRIVPIVGDSRKIHADLDDASFDFIFLDAMHDYDSVFLDISNYYRKLKDGGYFLMHDYNNADYPGVKKAALDLIGPPDKIVGSIGVYHKQPVVIPAPPKYQKIVAVSAFARQLPDGKYNPKNPPVEMWESLMSKLREAGIYTIQIGVAGEQFIGADEVRLNLTNASLRALLEEIDTFICVDTFFQHFATYYGKKGLVIFSQSDPEIFGHSSNVNLLKSRQFLRVNQFQLWTQTEYKQESFVTDIQIFDELSKLLNS